MPSPDHRAPGRRRAWGRGPVRLKLESLEHRSLMTAGAGASLPDLVNSSLAVSSNASDWAGSVEVEWRGHQPGERDDVRTRSRSCSTPRPSAGSTSTPSRSARPRSPPGWRRARPRRTRRRSRSPRRPFPRSAATAARSMSRPGSTPDNTIAESNTRNNRDLGPPYDSSPIAIQAQQPSKPGRDHARRQSDPTTTWGSTISVTAQVTNQGTGSSPQTTALLSLTPTGINYGTSTTVGIGTITIPPLGPYQTYNVVQNITLPAVEPLAIANYTSFGLTMTQDADYLTNDLYPNEPDQGVGYDQTPVTITTEPDLHGHLGPAARPGGLVDHGPDGHDPVGTVVPDQHRRAEPRPGSRGPVPGVLRAHRPAGSINDAIYLGQTTISSLAAGATAGHQPDADPADPPALGRDAGQRRLRPDRRDRGPRTTSSTRR